MSRRPVFHPEAVREFEEAWDWYEDREPGLGWQFEEVVYSALDAIAAAPRAWVSWPGLLSVRVFTIERFPFLLPFTVSSDTGRIVVLAVAHAKRRPGYWKSRIGDT